MSRPSFSRLISSKVIDDLLNLSDRRQPPNWLLTYIDVFVLIVMLVVTLISLSHFEPVVDQTAAYNAPPPPVNVIDQLSTIIPEQVNAVTPTTPDIVELSPQESHPETPPEETSSTDAQTENNSLAETPHPDNEDRRKGVSATGPAETLKPEEKASNQASEPASELKQNLLLSQLEQLGLSDSIALNITQGHAELEIQDDILYRSSDAELTGTGRSLLTRLTPLLKQAKGLIFIEGHTDNRPIKTARFPSNWELGAARATSVLHFLASQQIDAGRMRAVSFADTRPIADNASNEGRQKNRRVNIVIRIDEEAGQ